MTNLTASSSSKASSLSSSIFSNRGRPDFVMHLAGRGVELGALHEPLPVHHNPNIEAVSYVDRFTKVELIELFPELEEAEDKIVEPDMYCDLSAGIDVLSDASQDFVIAMHVIEHLPNPLHFLREVYRVLRPGGRLLLAAPDKRFTFDVNRPLTPLSLLEQKFRKKVTDVTDAEVEEFVRMTYPEPAPEEAEARKKFMFNVRQRSIHVHVWDARTFCQFITHFSRHHRPFHLLQAGLPEMNKFREILLLLEKRPSDSGVLQPTGHA